MSATLPDGARDRSAAPCGDFRNQFRGSEKRSESLSPICPQERWTTLEQAGTIVDVTLALAVLAGAATLTAAAPLDPQHLPPLPARGFARETKAGVELQTMRGRSLG